MSWEPPEWLNSMTESFARSPGITGPLQTRGVSALESDRPIAVVGSSIRQFVSEIEQSG